MVASANIGLRALGAYVAIGSVIGFVQLGRWARMKPEERVVEPDEVVAAVTVGVMLWPWAVWIFWVRWRMKR